MINESLSFNHPKITENHIRYRDGKVEVFDVKEGRYRKPYSYTKKQKRLFHRTYSGLQVGYHKKQTLIFATFTTQYEKKGEKGKETIEESEFNRKSKEHALRQAERELNADFQLFKDNLEYQVQKWRFEDWLLKTYGVVDRKEYRRLYKYNFHRFKYKLCYLKVRTTEGGGVIHVLIRKDPDIPKFDQKWCSQEWERIHGAKIVSLERIEVDPEQPLKDALNSAFYFCGNYFNQQPVVRQSSSYDWIFRGAACAWSGRKEVYGLKKEIVETRSFEYEKKFPFVKREYSDEGDVSYKTDYVPQLFKSHTESRRKNVLWVREGLIQRCCNGKKIRNILPEHEISLTNRRMSIEEIELRQKKINPYSYPLDCFVELGGSFKKDGFQRALELWMRLILEPHINTRQTKLTKFF